MSFGFSVCDFIAVGKLITDICSSLQSSGGSKSDYQDLQRELDILSQILDQLRQLPSHSTNANLDPLKLSVLTCQQALEAFRDKWKKYERSLGATSPSSRLRGITDKIRWGAEEQVEVQKLQTYLQRHNAMINTQLLQLGLEKIDAGFSGLSSQSERIIDITEDTQYRVVRIEESVAAQGSMVSSLCVLPSMIMSLANEASTSWADAMDMLKSICNTAEQAYAAAEKIYAVVIQLKGTPSFADARWSCFQDPVHFEDPFGAKFPVPSEYSGRMLHAIVRSKYIDGDIGLGVRNGNIQIYYANNPAQQISLDDTLRPGSTIIMAVVLCEGYFKMRSSPNECPRCYTQQRLVSAAGRHSECPACGLRVELTDRPFDVVGIDWNCVIRYHFTRCIPIEQYILAENFVVPPNPKDAFYRNVRMATDVTVGSRPFSEIVRLAQYRGGPRHQNQSSEIVTSEPRDSETKNA